MAGADTFKGRLPCRPKVADCCSRAEPDRGEGLNHSRKTPPCSRYSDWTPPVRRSRNAPKCGARQWGGGESRGQSRNQRSVPGGCLRPPSTRSVLTAKTFPAVAAERNFYRWLAAARLARSNRLKSTREMIAVSRICRPIVLPNNSRWSRWPRRRCLLDVGTFDIRSITRSNL